MLTHPPSQAGLGSIRVVFTSPYVSWLLLLMLGFALLGTQPAAAQRGGFIGLYADPEGTQPCIEAPVGALTEIFVIATNEGATADGFTGAEFRIEVSNPRGYIMTYEGPPDAVVVLGNPLDLTPDDPTDDTGVNVAYGTCQRGEAGNGHVPLGVIRVINLGGGPTTLRVKRRTPPTNSRFPSPLFTQCDAPMFTITPMRVCRVEPWGEEIAFEAALNDSSCSAASQACTAPCAGEAGVRLTAEPISQFLCPGDTTRVVVRALNTSNVPETIRIFDNRQEILIRENVAPGQVVELERAFAFENCNQEIKRIFFGATAENDACPNVAGMEAVAVLQCQTRGCDQPRCLVARVEAPTAIIDPFDYSAVIGIGSAGILAQDVFGISGRLTIERPDLFQAFEVTCLDENGDPLSLGPDAICFGKIDEATGIVDFAVSRKAGATGVSGILKVVRVRFKMNGIVLGGCTHLRLSDIKVLDSRGESICVDPMTGSALVCVMRPCSVYPGDTNNDGFVDANDIETLAAFWGIEGPARRRQGCVWGRYSVACWPDSGAMFSDAFGDGRVGIEDVLCIGFNWNKSHPIDGVPVSLPANADAEKMRAAYAAMATALADAGSDDPGIAAAKAALEQLMQGAAPPAVNRLGPNVPNPFNPGTRIGFSLAAAGRARIVVYDVLGRAVRTLVDADLAAGPHVTTWDGKDSAGRPMASGIYYYRAWLGSQTFARKMVLAK